MAKNIAKMSRDAFAFYICTLNTSIICHKNRLILKSFVDFIFIDIASLFLTSCVQKRLKTNEPSILDLYQNFFWGNIRCQLRLKLSQVYAWALKSYQLSCLLHGYFQVSFGFCDFLLNIYVEPCLYHEIDQKMPIKR